MIDETINHYLRPITDAFKQFIFYEVSLFDAQIPLIVVWLICAATFFTIYLELVNVRGFRHAIGLLAGSGKTSKGAGEVSHFQALTTALSGTVGVGNIGGMAIVISLGGPGAVFWLIVAGLLGMATKFAECILGVKYRKVNEKGIVSGGPMYYLERGLEERGFKKLGKYLGLFYAVSIVIGCLGIGNMFQSNQAYEQFVFATGGDASYFVDKGWLFGVIITILVGGVIVGGLKSIAKVTSKMVPFMALLYVGFAIVIIAMNAENLPWAVSAIFTEAFSPTGVAGGVIGVMIWGFQRAAFSNEAGIGSAAIAHSAVRTVEPVTEGYVGLLEPFIDTVVICTMTSLVILTTVYAPESGPMEVQGIELTSKAFGSTISWSVVPLSFMAILFAFSTMISWSYYGLKGWTYIFGESKMKESIFNVIFCLFVALGCVMQLDAVLDFSDAMVFLVAVPNIIGLYILAPVVKEEWKKYRQKRTAT